MTKNNYRPCQLPFWATFSPPYQERIYPECNRRSRRRRRPRNSYRIFFYPQYLI